MILESVLTCPVCGTASTETMPVDYCLVRYTCAHCGTVLKPKAGDCCVFCSYGSVVCPPMQPPDSGAVSDGPSAANASSFDNP